MCISSLISKSVRLASGVAALAVAVAGSLFTAQSAEAGIIGQVTLQRVLPNPAGVDQAPAGADRVQLFTDVAHTTLLQTEDLSKGGAFEWKTVTSNLIDFPAKFAAFCLEVNQNLINNPPLPVYNVDTTPGDAPVGTPSVPPMGTTAANYIQELWSNHIANALGAGASSIGAGAFQLAIWKIEYDLKNSAGITTGANGLITAVHFDKGQLIVSATNLTGTEATEHGNAIVNLATTWLKELTDPSLSGATMTPLWALTSNTAQDQLTPVDIHTHRPPVVPEPASLIVWLAVGALVGGSTLRARRKAAK